jgi:tRNA pseudouridine38-40 synthase
MAQRLKLIIAYDGTPFAGWQSQSHRNTIQDHLERAFEHITGRRICVHGAGRTDAGVHALAQCAHADVNRNQLTPERWMTALNGLLPPMIRVLRSQAVSQTFHARFSAKGKIYRYRIWSAPVLPPFEYKRAWHVTAPIDSDVMKSASTRFIGRHDFAGFTASRGQREKDTVRTIRSIRVGQRGSCLIIDFDADGFLYKMVRLIVGTLVQCGIGRRDVGDISEMLSSGRVHAGRLVAPAHALFLLRVRY